MSSVGKKIVKIISILLALAIFLSALLLGAVVYFNSPPGLPGFLNSDDPALRLENGNILYLEVRNGESALSVGRRLENAGFIRNQYFWQLISRLKDDFIKTGAYRIEVPATQLNIHAILVAGEQLLIRVTIPEGVTLKKTAAILEEAGICPASDFMLEASSLELREYYHVPGVTMEGYLFPDTYLFPPAYPARQVIQTMADTFFGRLADNIPEALSLPDAELFNRITLASIVEREYRINEEAPLMAGVFYNRLGIGMALQSCATVEYIITEVQGRPHPDVLYNRDLEIPDPYNTYLHPGLPPGPISAPGLVSLEAVFNPAPSGYFYFRLTDPNAGRHYFSATLDDHIRAGALYLKGN